MNIDFNELTYLEKDDVAVIPYGTDDALETAFKATGVKAYAFISEQDALKLQPEDVLRARGHVNGLDLYLKSRFDPMEIRDMAVRLSQDPDAIKSAVREAKAEYAWHEGSGQLGPGAETESQAKAESKSNEKAGDAS